MRKYHRSSTPSQTWQMRAVLIIFAAFVCTVLWSSSNSSSRTYEPFQSPQIGESKHGSSSLVKPTVATSPPLDSGIARVQFSMSAAMDDAWRKSSKRLTFPISLTINGDTAGSVIANATFYGKSSLKLKYTKRRSLQIDTATPVYVSRDAPAITSFLLLSLWEDKYRIAYISAVELLKEVGLFFSYTRLVELRCSGDSSNHDTKAVCGEGGRSFGAYLLVEYPSDAITRAVREELKSPSQKVCESSENFEARKAILQQLMQQSTTIDISTRNWFYYEKPPIYDVLRVPSYTRDSPLSPYYRKIEKDPLSFAHLSSVADGLQFDMEKYALWVAINAVLQNGDWDDEVFVYGIGMKFVSVMAWDYDNIFMPCHRVQKSVRSQLMFCAETPLEKAILSTPGLMKPYMKAMRCVLDEVATTEHWDSILENSANELQKILDASPDNVKATFDDSTTAPDLAKGKESLSRALAATRAALESALPAEVQAEVHATTDRNDKGEAHFEASTEKAEVLCPGELLQSDYLLLERAVKREFKRQGMIRLEPALKGRLPEKGLDIIAPNSSLVLAEYDNPLFLNDPGLYCATAKIAKPAGCVGFVVRPFVVRSASRGSAEFAVPHFNKPEPQSLAHEHAPKGALLTATCPRSWPSLANAFPAILTLSTKDQTSSGGRLWLRRNTRVYGEKVGESSMIIRGRSAMRVVSSDDHSFSDKLDGPLLHRIQDGPGSKTTLHVSDAEGSSITVSIASPSWPSPDSFTEIDAFLAKTDFSAKPCNVRITASVIINAGTTVVFGPGCVIEMGPRSSIVVEGVLQLLGSASDPITVTGTAQTGQHWNTIYVRGAQAELDAHHVFFGYSGLKGELIPATGKHHASSATITFTDSSSSVIEECYFVFLQGPAFAGGSNATINVINSVVQWAEMGVECVDCHFASNGSVWTNFPTWDSEYADSDNDGMYLSGGIHVVQHSVIAHTKDDGIDSGSPEKHRGRGGSLLVENSIIEMCQHEGVALSSAPRTIREALVQHTLIQYCQQGVENGYTGRGHAGTARALTIAHTHVGLRYGDNYYNRPQDGTLTVTNVLLRDNLVNALNYVRKIAAPQEALRFALGANIRASVSKVFQSRPDCDLLYPLRHREVVQEAVRQEAGSSSKEDADREMELLIAPRALDGE